MSYSRREVPFVDHLVDDLKKLDFTIWLDYRSLIPGTPWASHRNMFIAMLVLGALILWQYLINDSVLEAFGIYDRVDDFRGFSADFPPIIYVVGNILMLLFALWKRADMYRWFPARVKRSK